MMIERVGVHGPDQANIVGAGSRMGDEIRILGAALAVGFEFSRAGQHRGGRLDECQLELAGHGGRQRLALPFFELGLGIEKIHLAGSAFHEHEDDVLGFRRERRRFGSQRIGAFPRSERTAVQQICERDGAQASRAIAQEQSPAVNLLELLESHLYSLVINSSRLSSTRLTPTQAAASSASTPCGWNGCMFSGALGSFASNCFCCSKYSISRARSGADGGRARTSWNA